jgi:hypothetical protein
MVDHPLDDCYLNIERAKERFDALEVEAIEWFETHDESAVIGFDVNTGQETVKIEHLPALPTGWGLTVAEIVNHLRSALDYLVYELSIKGGGEPERERTTFPIARSPEAYYRLIGKGKRRRSYRDICLAGVAEQWKTEVDKLQPYEPGGRMELAALVHLSNSSKHRTGLRVRMCVLTKHHVLFMESGDFIKSLEARIVKDKEGQVKIEAVTPRRNRELLVVTENNPNAGPGMSIAFGPHPPVTPAQVKLIITGVEEIIDVFKPAFDP